MANSSDEILYLSGKLTYHNVSPLLEKIKNQTWASPIGIDFKSVEEIDTSLISVIFEFQREAKKNNSSCTLINIPDNLKVLAKLYGVEQYLTQKN
ncbi:MAG: STAS domain-containing protein [Methylophilaceae bacterium]